MPEIYRGHRIYQSIEQEMREVISPVGFPFSNVLDTKSAHGCSPGFENKEPKFFVRLTHDRQMWLLGRHSDFLDQWERYMSGDEEPDDDYCGCVGCLLALATHNRESSDN